LIIDHEKINNAVSQLIKEKTGWDDKKIEHFFNHAKSINKSQYEMICEIENIATYAELAMSFSKFTGIPYEENIYGDVQDIQRGRYIKTSNGTIATYYIWHPLALRGTNVDGAKVAIVGRDIIIKHSGESFVVNTTNEDAKEHLKEIIKDAIRLRATDIHFSPIVGKGIYRLMFRIMGDLVDIGVFQIEVAKSIVATILHWAKEHTPSLQPDDTRRPQDGMFEVTKEDIGIDITIRVSCIWKPNMRDADIVLRMLYKTDVSNETVYNLGFSGSHARLIGTLLTRNQGIVLVTGSTGSGKSRTVNTILGKFPRTKNILTVEDPIEYYLPFGRQFQTIEWEEQRGGVVNICKTGFADYIRAFKRHDPDIIFIGELRDKETVDASFHLAKTGHLVFGTLHANKVTMVPEILIEDYGISIDVISDNLLMGIGQVLVKKLCNKCKKSIHIDSLPDWIDHLRFVNIADIKSRILECKTAFSANVTKDAYCSCVVSDKDGQPLSKGYSGRTLLAEVYEFYPDIFKGEISSLAIEKKMLHDNNMLSDAVEKIEQGIVDLSSLMRLL
jgi:type II secretory ATPase GspE/PulE/Tfp pilus assembly ATPase PilB-like protein